MADIFTSYDIIGVLHELGVLRYLDRAFFDFIFREDDSPERRLVALLAGLVSYATTGLNNVCIDPAKPLALLDTAYQEFTPEEVERFSGVCEDIRSLVAGVDLREVFLGSRTVAVDPEDGAALRPLVYSAGRLYLWRYWEAEEKVAAAVRRRAAGARGASVSMLAGLPPLESVYKRFTDMEKTRGQQLAVFAALRSAFSVITGGPGTGKTTVVAVILALYFRSNPEARVVLAAPTGKAQARLKESVFAELEYLNISDETAECIRGIEVRTVHSLLGLDRQGKRRQQELSYDLVVVDEASMVSILLFQELFSVLGDSSRLILLGDRDQLAAVDGGAVLSDLCASVEDQGSFSREFVADLKEYMSGSTVCPEVAETPGLLQDVIVPLEYTFRFAEDSGIGRMKDLLSSGQEAFAGFMAEGYRNYSGSLGLHDFRSGIFRVRQRELGCFLEGWQDKSECGVLRYLDYLQAPDVAAAYNRFCEFKIITVVNKGLLGVEGVNRLLLEMLGMQEEGAKGLPVMIERNDYQNMLFNGDIGMFWPDSDGVLKVWFPDLSADNGSGGGFRAFSPAQLPSFSPAFAMTVHKSQGSGFGSVLLILPSADSSILTRELLYTAVTRAKRRIDIFGRREMIVSAAMKSVCRYSGLVAKLS